jgi:ketosteroid isomerase-like protein
MAEPAPKIESSDALGKIGNIVCDALTAGDLNTLLQCYESGATVMFDTGEPAVGRDAIGKALADLTTTSPTITYKNAEILESDDLALTRHTWTFKGNDPNGNPADETFAGTGVARRQPNGDWLIAIDSPYNAD